MALRLNREGYERVMRKAHEDAQAKYSTAGQLYPAIDQTKRPPIDGWAKQRQQWNEHDHRARGPISPLGGVARRK